MAAGNTTGAAMIAPPAAARHNPTFRMIRKNFDVGAVNRSTKVSSFFSIIVSFKMNGFKMIYPFFQELDFLIHQVVDPFEFSLNERCCSLHLCDILLYPFKVSVQLLKKIGNCTKQE
jgi:hypothetical protein